ncbi:MAG: D-alanyl-D-alanine carboxypeptidase/D-alanyl-D-alanine-endopeptidase [Gammaproteobacteria bacterium]|nr:D-alanyl-D-alanine carboxypeptidase/D-alanyl-D-alanine-endopeptidase [Gammaproteobacteria bacterium]
MPIRFPSRVSPLLAALACAAQLCASPAAAQEELPRGGWLPAAVRDALARHGLPESSLSVVVQEVGAAEPLLAWLPDTPRNPASVMKLVTTLAALDMLGPGHRWQTALLATEPVIDGKLDGDLYLRGGGDPYIVTETFWKFLHDLRLTGLEHVTGDLVVDESLFQPTPEDPAAFDGRPYRSYNVAPRAMLVNFLTTRFIFRPDEARGRVVISADPPLANLEVINDLRLTDGRCGRYLRRLRMDVERRADGAAVRFQGVYPAACGTFHIDRAVSDALPYVYGVFAALWRGMGGRLDGGVRAGVTPAHATVLHEMSSPTLAELVRAINKHSNNVMTRTLLLALGVARYGPPGTEAKGRDAVRAWLAEQGIDTSEVVLENGAGLSRDERISASAVAAILLDAYAMPLMPEFVSSLPLTGVDGTMRRRHRDGDIANRGHLKTGLIDDVSAVAGYLMSASDRRWVVVSLQNHRGVHRGIGKRVQDALIEWVYAQ